MISISLLHFNGLSAEDLAHLESMNIKSVSWMWLQLAIR